MKKTYKVFIIILIGLGLLITIMILFPKIVPMIQYRSLRWMDSAFFKEYKREFVTIKDYLLYQFQDDTSERTLYVYFVDGEWRLYDEKIGEYIVCPKDVQAAVNTVTKKAFTKDAELSYISISQDRLAFVTDNRSYALVFSMKGRPNYVNSVADGNVYVKNLGEKWYHVKINPN